MTKIISSYKQSKHKTTSRFKLRTFNIILLSCIIISGVFYLINISDLAVKGFTLKTLKSQVVVLGNAVQVNIDKVDALQSYYTLNNKKEALDMVAVNNIDYITIPDVVLAKK